MSKNLLALFWFCHSFRPALTVKDSGNLSPIPLPDFWKGAVRFSGHKQVTRSIKNKMSYINMMKCDINALL